MTTDYELKVNTEHFIRNDKDDFVKNEKNKIMSKLDVGQTGLRRSPQKDKDVIDLKEKALKKARFERSNSKKIIKLKDPDEEHPDGINSTLP